MDEECSLAEITGAGLILELDGNCKIGPKYLKGDKHPMLPNGRLFLDVIKRNNLTIVNTTNLCEGLVTRSRKTTKLNEESSIDFVVVCQKNASLCHKNEN